MKLQVKCDGCGKVGTANEILPCVDGEDLCEACELRSAITELQNSYDRKKKWLDSTHLEELRDIERQIVTLDNKLTQMLSKKLNKTKK